MATVGDLVRKLEILTYNLNGRRPDDTVQSHVVGWMILAKPTLRAIRNLPVGGRRDYINASFRAVFQPMLTGPRKEMPGELRPAGRLVEVAQTMGALADLLSETVRIHPNPGLGGAEAIKLEAAVLVSVHMAAHWSRSTLGDQSLASTRHSLMASLGDVIALTEPWALIPPASRASALESLKLPNAHAPGIEGATVAWADAAKIVLQERYRGTGWAMQAIAGTLALLSHLTRDAVLTSGIRQASRTEIADQLTQGIRAWRTAATWPPNLRLGGRTEGLRPATRALHDVCAAVGQPDLEVMRHALAVAEPVSLLHASVMERLVANHELWIHGVIPGSQGDYAKKWMRVHAKLNF